MRSDNKYKNNDGGDFVNSLPELLAIRALRKGGSLCKNIVIAITLLFFVSCNVDETTPTFNDNYSTLYTFLEEHEEFSLYKAIVDAAQIESSTQTMKSVYTSYNSNTGENIFTLFLPENAAVEKYLTEKGLSIGELTKLPHECWELAANHLINQGLYSRNFPNGEIAESSLNGERHTIRYEESENGVVYLIDEIASVLVPDYNVSNGVIHVIDNVLIPISYTSSEWLAEKSEYSIFYQALQITGLNETFKNLDSELSPLTMFVESDLVFQGEGIGTIDALKAKISPGQTNYTEETNPLYQFMAYHVLRDKALYVSDMTDGRSNFETYTSYPLSITLNSDLSQLDGLSVGIALNKGYKVYESIINENNDTIVVDYVSLYDSKSNKPTLNGVLHFLNHVLEVNKVIVPAAIYIGFDEDPVILHAQQDIANFSYVFRDSELSRFEFGGELESITYYRSDDENELARSKDYLSFNGFYQISYTTTRLLQGNYKLEFRMNANKLSGLADVYMDGKKVGATINMDALSAPSAANPYLIFSVGTVKIEGYKEHVITLKAITPGSIVWDYIRFMPI